MADTDTPPPAEEQDDTDALEIPESGAESLETAEGSPANQTIDATTPESSKETIPTPPPEKKGSLRNILRRFNVYLLLFVFILMLAGIILAIAYFQSKKASTTSTLKTQSLTQSTLQQLATSDATIGSSQQVLNVQSSAVFAGKVLVKDGLEVAGSLQVSGTVALSDITVSGSGQFGQLQVHNNLSVAGDAGIQGNATVSKNLQVSGTGNFSGAISAPQITTSNLQLNGDLVLTHHISAGGATPGLARGPALGNGGSASVGGSDTSGSVSINIGSGATAGCFAAITFATKYNATPHVLLTPVGASAGTLDYYVTRTTTGFEICDASAPPTGSSFAFDYFILD
jgi:cytoskeletal protein CcmA (bactofilin family)